MLKRQDRAGCGPTTCTEYPVSLRARFIFYITWILRTFRAGGILRTWGCVGIWPPTAGWFRRSANSLRIGVRDAPSGVEKHSSDFPSRVSIPCGACAVRFHRCGEERICITTPRPCSVCTKILLPPRLAPSEPRFTTCNRPDFRFPFKKRAGDWTLVFSVHTRPFFGDITKKVECASERKPKCIRVFAIS